MTPVARSSLASQAWDDVVRGSPDGWVFGLTAWLDMIGRVPRWELEDHSFGLEHEGRLLAVVPLHYVARHRRLASSGWGWIGPVVAPGLHDSHEAKVVKAAHEEIRAIAARLGAIRIELAAPAVTARSIANRWGVNPFAGHGYQDTSTVTRVIDLAPDEAALWAGLSKDARYQIRQAEKNGYTAAIEPWPDMLDDYYRTHEETYARSDLPAHPREYFEGFARDIDPTGHATLMVGRDPSGQPVAFHNTVRFAVGAIYTTGCGASAHRDSGIDYLLFWRAMLAAKASGAGWYEAGEVHLATADPKLQGLATFKSKFGGELHRYFRGSQDLLPLAVAAVAPIGRRAALAQWAAATRTLAAAALRPITSRLRATEAVTPAAASQAAASDAARSIKETYATGDLYATNRICTEVAAQSPDFIQVLLNTKLGLVRSHYSGGLVLDLCCATGGHLFTLSDSIEQGLGVDFAERYLHHARAHAPAGNLSFLCADAKRLPVKDASVSLVYSLSSLYAIPGVAEVFAEIARVLRPGGVAVLDLGNSRSLNAYCLRAGYRHWPPIFPITVGEMLRLCARSGLALRMHRSFQLLPLWAGEPRWLWPLLHPAWKRMLQRRLGGKMLDEWISSLPGIRNFAFRHVLVCERTGGPR